MLYTYNRTNLGILKDNNDNDNNNNNNNNNYNTYENIIALSLNKSAASL